MNKVILTGNIANDPELRATPNGVSCCTFRLAVERKYKDDAGNHPVDFISIVTWRKQAENVAKYMSKGRFVCVVGTWQTRDYTKDGVKHYISECIADEVEFTGTAPER